VDADSGIPGLPLVDLDRPEAPRREGPQQGGIELSLSAAAAQFFDVATQLTLGAALLVSIAAYIVMRLYMRTISRESQRGGALTEADPSGTGTRQPLASAIGPLEIHTEKPGRKLPATSARSPTFRHAEVAFPRAARIYVLAGSVQVAASVALLFLFRIFSAPSTPSQLTIVACYAAVFWSWSVITLAALALFWGPERRFRALLVLGYVVILPVMGVVLSIGGASPLSFADVGLMEKDAGALVLAYASAVTGQQVTADTVTFSPLTQPIMFWSLALPPLMIPVVFFNRFVRGTVGPLFISVALVLVLSTFLIGDLALYTSPGVWIVRRGIAVFRESTYVVLLIVSLALSAVVAGLGLWWIARRYRRRQLSDQTFLFDTLWLSTSVWLCVYLMGGRNQFLYVLGLVPFALYKTIVGFRLRRLAAEAARLPQGRLLFLRVFGTSSRSEKLFDLLAGRWRYAGGIRLIGATDVARGRFEPDELLEFLGGRLGRSFISTRDDLDRRLARLDLGPDPDGRYRVEEFFCRADTWQPTVTRLMPESDLVAMDLRGFRQEKQGSIFELGTLIDTVPLERVALLIDRTTDEPLLRRTLADLWRTMNPGSPNASGGSARLRLIDLAYGYPAAVRSLLQRGDELLA
jgi:hypothetical protein